MRSPPFQWQNQETFGNTFVTGIYSNSLSKAVIPLTHKQAVAVVSHCPIHLSRMDIIFRHGRPCVWPKLGRKSLVTIKPRLLIRNHRYYQYPSSQSPRMDRHCWIVFNYKSIVNVDPNNNNNKQLPGLAIHAQ